MHKSIRHLSLYTTIYLSFGCKCPQMLAPAISVNSNKIISGGKIILAASHPTNTSVYWEGPAGSHYGESWVIDSVKKEYAGEYKVYYFMKRGKCQSPVISTRINIEDIHSIPRPNIAVENPFAMSGETIVLEATPIVGTEVKWMLPDGEYTGNPLLIKNSTPKNSGVYTATYVYPGSEKLIANLSATRELHIEERDKKIKYNNKDYYIDYVPSGNQTTVYLRADKTKNDASLDIPAFKFNVEKTTIEEAKISICRNVQILGDAEFYHGCLRTLGSAACIIGAKTLHVKTVPFCTFIMETLKEDLTTCIEGGLDQFASTIDKDLETKLIKLGFDINSLPRDPKKKYSVGRAMLDLVCKDVLDQAKAKENINASSTPNNNGNSSDRKSSTGTTGPTGGGGNPGGGNPGGGNPGGGKPGGGKPGGGKPGGGKPFNGKLT